MLAGCDALGRLRQLEWLELDARPFDYHTTKGKCTVTSARAHSDWQLHVLPSQSARSSR